MVGNALYGTFESNFYNMAPGNTCMIRLENGMMMSSSFWKVWKDDLGLEFYFA